MIRHLIAPVLSMLTLSGAMAADLPARAARPSLLAASPTFSWAGFYAGVHAGATFDQNQSPRVSTTGIALGFDEIYTNSGGHRTAFTGGAHVGYNLQNGMLVTGLEADINYLGRKGSNGAFPAPIDYSGGYDNRTAFLISNGGRDQVYGTVRARLGLAFDRVLVYATGGLAMGARMNYSVAQREAFETTDPILFGPSGSFVTNPVRALPSSANRNDIGWAVGAGAEYAFTQTIGLRLEYMHVNLGSTTQTFTTLASAPNATVGAAAGAIQAAGNRISVRYDNAFDLVRAGVNFRF